MLKNHISSPEKKGTSNLVFPHEKNRKFKFNEIRRDVIERYASDFSTHSIKGAEQTQSLLILIKIMYIKIKDVHL